MKIRMFGKGNSMNKLFFITCVLGIVTIASTSNAADLLAYWEFNDVGDAANAVDSTVGRVGVLEGGAAYTADTGGRTGAAGDYGMDLGIDSAGQLVRVSDASFLNTGTDTVTYSFWEKLDNVANSSAFWAVSPSSSSGERGAQAHVPWGNGTIFFDTAGCCDGATQRISGAPPEGHDFTAGWSHYAFVKNGADKEVWVNGALAFAGSNTDPLPTDFTRLMLGSDDLGNNSLQGQIDDFAIFGDALSEDLIGRLSGGESALTIPEPSGLMLLLWGIFGLALHRRRR